MASEQLYTRLLIKDRILLLKIFSKNGGRTVEALKKFRYLKGITKGCYPIDFKVYKKMNKIFKEACPFKLE